MLYAVKYKYLDSRDNKWHYKTTNWYDNSHDAWREKDRFECERSRWILESSGGLMHKNEDTNERDS